MRVYELAREVGVPSRRVLEVLEGWELGGRTASSSVPPEAIERLRTPGVLDPAAPLHVPEVPAERAGPVAVVPDSAPLTVAEVHRSPGPKPARTPSPVRERHARAWDPARTLATWTVIGMIGGILATLSVPHLFGYRSVGVLSGSMEPTIRAADVLIVKQVSPLDVRPGDVVTFRDPEDPSRLITHRVREMERDGPEVRFVTKGDKNTGTERWGVVESGTIGLVRYRVPWLGYGMYWARSMAGRLLLVVLPALALGSYELWRIWHPTRKEVRGGVSA